MIQLLVSFYERSQQLRAMYLHISSLGEKDTHEHEERNHIKQLQQTSAMWSCGGGLGAKISWNQKRARSRGGCVSLLLSRVVMFWDISLFSREQTKFRGQISVSRELSEFRATGDTLIQCIGLNSNMIQKWKICLDTSYYSYMQQTQCPSAMHRKLLLH